MVPISERCLVFESLVERLRSNALSPVAVISSLDQLIVWLDLDQRVLHRVEIECIVGRSVYWLPRSEVVNVQLRDQAAESRESICRQIPATPQGAVDPLGDRLLPGVMSLTRIDRPGRQKAAVRSGPSMDANPDVSPMSATHTSLSRLDTFRFDLIRISDRSVKLVRSNQWSV